MAKPKPDDVTATDTQPSPVALPNAATLLDEVQQRCNRLRDWQQETQASLARRAEVIQRREKQLDETQQLVDLGRNQLELDQDALKRARMMFDKERAQLDQSQQALENERQRLDRAKAEVNEKLDEVLTMREKMDAEWASLSRIRQAQQALASALESERERVSELRITGSFDESQTPDEQPDNDDRPGLSLTQAA